MSEYKLPWKMIEDEPPPLNTCVWISIQGVVYWEAYLSGTGFWFPCDGDADYVIDGASISMWTEAIPPPKLGFIHSRGD